MIIGLGNILVGGLQSSFLETWEGHGGGGGVGPYRFLLSPGNAIIIGPKDTLKIEVWAIFRGSTLEPYMGIRHETGVGAPKYSPLTKDSRVF